MNNKLIFNKYKLKKLIYSSKFSDVYEGFNEKEKEEVAIKIEKKSKSSFLESEAYFLFNLQGFGIPKFITYGKRNNYNILIEELLGKSILSLWNFKNKKELKLKNTCMLALQIIERLEFIHSKNVIHRDIKPNNFIIGRKNPEIIYLIDFGFARKYKSSRTGKHIKFGRVKNSFGSEKYSSINSNKFYEQSRRDDLESLGYMLIFLLTNNLPWLIYVKILSLSHIEIFKKILIVKMSTKPEVLCKGLPNEFSDYIKYCRNLEFEEDPNYSYLKGLFTSILIKNHLKNDLIFFWIKKLKIDDHYKTHSQYILYI